MPRPLLIAALLAPLPACSIIADDARPTVDFEAIAETQNNFRGIVNTKQPVMRTNLHASLPVEKWGGTLTVGSDTTWDLSNQGTGQWFPGGHAGEPSQVETFVAYSEQYHGLDVTTGLISYALQNPDDFPFAAERGETKEFFVEVQNPNAGKLIPWFRFHYDFDEVHDAYAAFGLKKFFTTEKYTVELGSNLGWSSEGQSDWNYGFAKEGFAHFDFGAEMTYFVDDHTSVLFGAHSSTIVDGAIQDWLHSIGIDTSNFWLSVGVVLSY
ncbi:MAG: hypothetical protein R3F34_12195 [Planctomycetota bacterium]